LWTKKILPFNPKPMVDAYSLYASRFAIQSNYNELKPLLIMNHLMLCYYSNDHWLDFNFGGYRRMGYLETDITHELPESDLINYLINKIFNNSYILLALDHYFIQNTASYRQQHFMHDIAVVYGFDQSAGVFYLADNVDEFCRFKSFQAPFDQTAEARRYVENHPPCPERVLAYSQDIQLKECYQFNTADVIRVLNDYLQSRYTFSMNHIQDFTAGEKVFGIEIYNILGNMLENYRRGHQEMVDIRAFHALMNHKSVLIMLIDFMRDHHLLHHYQINWENFKRIFDLSLILRNLLLKMFMSGDGKPIERAVNLLDEVRNREITAINYLLENIVYDSEAITEKIP
jgi:hypothetical protein